MTKSSGARQLMSMGIQPGALTAAIVVRGYIIDAFFIGLICGVLTGAGMILAIWGMH